MPGFRPPKKQSKKIPGLPGPAMAGKFSKFGLQSLGRLLKKKKFPTVSEKILRKVARTERMRKKPNVSSKSVSVQEREGLQAVKGIGVVERPPSSGLTKLSRPTAGKQKTTPVQRAKAEVKKPMKKKDRRRR